MKIEIRKMTREDIIPVCKADDDMSDDFIEYLEFQLKNQDNGECSALIALCDGEVAGYVYLYYNCRWGGCKNQGLPSIVDLKVFDNYRRNGVASQLLDAAERIAKKYAAKVYLDVGLNRSYGAAQILYIKRGYIPNGNGVYFKQNVCQINEQYINNGELILCLIKEL